MSISSVSSPNAKTQLYEGLSSDTKPSVGVQAFAEFSEADTGDKYIYSGSSWALKEASGAVVVSGLARSAVRVISGTYNATEILGFRVLVPGSGPLTLSPVSGVTDIVITGAELTAMGISVYHDWPMHLDSITLGNADMEVLVYIPS